MPAFVSFGAVAEGPRGFEELCERDRVTCLAGSATSGPAAAGDAAVRVPPLRLAFDAARRGRVVALSSRCEGALPIPAGSPFQGRLLAWRQGADGRPGFPMTLLNAAASARCDDTAQPGPPSAVQAASRSAPQQASDTPAAAKTLMQLVKRTNSMVNRKVVERSDLVTRGVDDDWRRPDPSDPIGDCEDISIEKRMRLVGAGFPPDRLFYGVVYRSGVGLHVVLLARFSTGDVVLDNLSPRILAWRKTRYRWLRLQSPGNPTVWQQFGEGTGEGKLV
jgi:predicted transglutaminase-like cysteine proteinase